MPQEGLDVSIAKTGQGAGGGERTEKGAIRGYRRRATARLPKRSRPGTVTCRLSQPESWFYLNTSISLIARSLHPVSAFKGNVCAKLGTGVRR